MARASFGCHRRRPASAVVGVDERRDRPGAARWPSHTISISPKAPGWIEVDHALLVQLEQGQEPHDDLEPLDERRGQLPEA